MNGILMVLLLITAFYFWALIIISRLKKCSLDEAVNLLGLSTIIAWFNDNSLTFETDTTFMPTIEFKLEQLLEPTQMSTLRKLISDAVCAPFIQFYAGADGLPSVGIAVGNVTEQKQPVVEGVLKDVVQSYLIKYKLPPETYSRWSTWQRYGVPILEFTYSHNKAESDKLAKLIGSNFKSVSVENVIDTEEEFNLF